MHYKALRRNFLKKENEKDNEHVLTLMEGPFSCITSFTPKYPITSAALGACSRACSRAVFHSYKSSDVSAWNFKTARKRKRSFTDFKSKCPAITSIRKQNSKWLLIFSNYNTEHKKIQGYCKRNT